MGYKYNYSALMNADPAVNNFKALSDVKNTADYNNMATALLEAKGLTAGTDEADAFIAAATASGHTTVSSLQNLGGLSESDTAEARGDTWGGSDDTMGKSWLEAVVSGAIDPATVSTEDLYTKGFVRDADASGLEYWDKQFESGQTIEQIATHFLQSEEATYRTGYHDVYGRDADQSGLDYWIDDLDYDASDQAAGLAEFNRILTHTGDDYEQKETTVRNLLSSELGIHSSDEQRDSDSSLDIDGDGKADIFTDASEADVFRMMKTDDLVQVR